MPQPNWCFVFPLVWGMFRFDRKKGGLIYQAKPQLTLCSTVLGRIASPLAMMWTLRWAREVWVSCNMKRWQHEHTMFDKMLHGHEFGLTNSASDDEWTIMDMSYIEMYRSLHSPYSVNAVKVYLFQGVVVPSKNPMPSLDYLCWPFQVIGDS